MTTSLALRSLTLACLATGVSAADLARWRAGPGDVAGHAATNGTTISAGQTVRSDAKLPARIELAGGAKGVLTLSPGTELTLSEQGEGQAQELVVDVAAGAVQIDLANKGGYAAVEVQSGGLELRITGTLLVVERMAKDEAYVALIHGRVAARARAMARAVEKWLDLHDHQGIGIALTGLIPVQELQSRPQINSPPGSRPTVQQQSQGIDRSERELSAHGFDDWHRDNATAEIVAHLAGQDLDDAKALVVEIARVDPQLAGQAIVLSDEHAAALMSAAVTGSPATATQTLTAAAASSPPAAAVLTQAAIIVAPGQAGQLAAAAKLGAPDMSRDIDATAQAPLPSTASTGSASGAGASQLGSTSTAADGTGQVASQVDQQLGTSSGSVEVLNSVKSTGTSQEVPKDTSPITEQVSPE
jgi:hypothetical protein